MKELSFDPNDPSLWRYGFTHYNTHNTQREDFEEFGFSRKEMLAIMFLRKLRNTTTRQGLSLFMTVEGRHRCLARGDTVFMADGSWKNVEDVRCGDEVFSPQHNKTVIPAKVIALHSHFEENVYDVMEPKLENKRLYTCSWDHKIPLVGIKTPRIKDPDGGADKRPMRRVYKEYTAEHIARLKRSVQSRVVSFTTSPIDFKRVDSGIEPHCLGLWLGDGSCRLMPSKLSSICKMGMTKATGDCNITTNDKEIIDAFNEKYPGEMTSIGHKNGTTAVSLRISTKPIARFFNEIKRLGLAGKDSGTKFIPKECLLSSIPYRIKLLAGIIDTDGFVPKDNCTVEITTKSPKLAKDIDTLVHSLGGHGNITKIKKGIKSIGFIGEYFCVRFAFKSEYLIPLANEVRVKMKKERLLDKIRTYETTNRNHKNYDPRHVSIKCVKTDPQTVYGFTLDSPSGLFITNDWLVTHNSGKSRGFHYISCLWSKAFEQDMNTFNVSDADQLLALVEKIRSEGIWCPVIIVDEAGNSLNTADWFEKMQKAVIKTLTVIGILLPTIIFIAPNKNLVLSGIRNLSHYHVRVERTSNDHARMTFVEVHYNSLQNKTYFKKPRVRYLGMPIKLRYITITLPPKHINDAYDEIEKTRKPIMLKEIRDEAMRSRIKQEREVVDFDRIADLISKNPHIFETDRSRPDKIRLDANLIRAKFKLSYRDAETIKRLAEKNMDAINKGSVGPEVVVDEPVQESQPTT